MSGPAGSSQWMYATGFDVDQSLRFNDDDAAYLSKTFASAGNRRTFTFSAWVKRGNIGVEQHIFDGSTGGDSFYIRFNSDNTLQIRDHAESGLYFKPTALFRDCSAWYHFVLAVDTTQGTQANRVKFYVNGEQVTSWSASTYPSQNDDTGVNGTTEHRIGRDVSGGKFDGYMGEVNFIDGLAKAPADFGETGDYGEWKPIRYSGSYGTNGFYLPFKQDYTVEGFSTVVYKGNGTSQYIGGTGFQPDMLWVKERTSTSSHQIHDAIRGAGTALFTNATSAESTSSTYVSSFNTDGFNVGSSGSVNSSSDTYVAWNWDMGGSNATNTDGSINSTVRANASYGQSIVSYTGTASSSNTDTVGHGLSQKPELYFLKNRDTANSWLVRTDIIDGSSDYLLLDSTQAKADSGVNYANSSVFSLGASNGDNGSGDAQIAYCFHSVTGYSKFASFSGNGSASGATQTCGFKPAFVLIKRSSSTGDWRLWDNTRTPQSGTALNHLLPNSSAAENTSIGIEFLDTGFKCKSADSEINASGSTYIYMAFADTREYAYWLDQSGNNNDWTSNNLTESDVMVDSPTNNFCTWNSVWASHDTLSEGNLKTAGDSSWDGVKGTFGFSSGKWYFEELALANQADYNIGIQITSNTAPGDQQSASGTSVVEVYDSGSSANRIRHEGSYISITGGYAASGSIMGFAIDMDNSTLKYYLNGTLKHTQSLDASFDEVAPFSAKNHASASHTNFGQDSSFAGNKTAQGNQDGNSIGDFYYTPPTGYLALCTKNLPEPGVIPSEHFNTVLYTGDDGTQAITGVGFQPNFTWIKCRSHGGNDSFEHILTDAVRGVNKTLSSDKTASESTNNTTGYLSVFGSDGFTVTGGDAPNGVGRTYAAWNWKANGSGSSNTDGDLNSTVSVNTDAGFSIVKYVGNQNSAQTIGHGLGVVPEMMIVKNTSRVKVWAVYHKDIGNEYALDLSATTAKYDSNIRWNDTTPTSALFTVGTSDETNYTNDNHIAYCFHSVDGYSKVGSYTGNGNADGTFVYTGFRPAYVMIKPSSRAGHWMVANNKSSPSNVVDKVIFANDSAVEYTDPSADCKKDFLSNGFKIYTTDDNTNESGATYIYLAFAETPFKYSNAR